MYERERKKIQSTHFTSLNRQSVSRIHTLVTVTKLYHHKYNQNHNSTYNHSTKSNDEKSPSKNMRERERERKIITIYNSSLYNPSCRYSRKAEEKVIIVCICICIYEIFLQVTNETTPLQPQSQLSFLAFLSFLPLISTQHSSHSNSHLPLHTHISSCRIKFLAFPFCPSFKLLLLELQCYVLSCVQSTHT